jgi:hypothetical protein
VTSLDNALMALVVLGLIVVRQLQPRAVRSDRPYLLMLVLGVVGLVDLVGFTSAHRVSVAAWVLLLGGLLVGAGFGVARGALVHVWRQGSVAMRQGNAITVVLWLAGLGVHLVLDLLIDGVDRGAAGIGTDTILLYLAVALAAQRFTTIRRAQHLDLTAA